MDCSTHLKKLIAATFLLSLSACSGSRAWTTTDAWYHPEPTASRAVADKRTEVPFAQVKPSARKAAAQKLEGVQLLPISLEEAAAYVETLPRPSEGSTYFLVRGLVLNRGTGRFSAFLAGENLYIHHSSLGHHAVPMDRQPLIVALPKTPREVYIWCSMAE